MMGVISVLLMSVFSRRNKLIDQLSRELDKNLMALIRKVNLMILSLNRRFATIIVSRK